MKHTFYFNRKIKKKHFNLMKITRHVNQTWKPKRWKKIYTHNQLETLCLWFCWIDSDFKMWWLSKINKTNKLTNAYTNSTSKYSNDSICLSILNIASANEIFFTLLVFKYLIVFIQRGWKKISIYFSLLIILLCISKCIHIFLSHSKPFLWRLSLSNLT